MTKIQLLGIALSVILSGAISHADNKPAAGANSAEKLLSDATALYSQRATASQLDQLIQLLASEDKTVESADAKTKYQLRILEGRALYYKAMHNGDNVDERLSLLEQSMAKQQSAIAAADLAEAHFWYSASLGRWAETKGVLASLGRKDEMIKELETAKSKSTLAGKAGETVDSYGPVRVLGRMYDKLPFFAGGSRAKAKENLDRAYQNAPNFLLNVQYRAELYASGSDDEKTEACRSINEAMKLDPLTLDADRVPENLEDYESLKQLKSDLCD